LRDLEAVVELATTAGFELAEIVEMPANNFSVVLRKRSGSRRSVSMASRASDIPGTVPG
jgi:hypothetical protein